MNEAPRKIAEEGDGLSQLKALLFRGEADRLKAVEANVEALGLRLGDAPRLEAATAEVLVEALRRAEAARHQELAHAIAPVVIASIRNEIKNSRETMVETLYPITGQMVIAAVANALREALASVNERIDRLTSLDRWKLQLRARWTGRPVSELALADSTKVRVSRVLFLERHSGILLASWRADGQPEERGELISGLLAALTGFSRDAFGDSGGQLRTLDFGGRDIHVHASPTHLIATEVTGALRADQKASLDQDCLVWLAQYARDGVATNAVFGHFIQQALERARPPVKAKKGAGWPLKIAAGALALLVVGFTTRAMLRSWQERGLQTALASLVASRPGLAGYPLEIATDHTAGRVAVRGLAPSLADVDALTSGLREAAGGYSIAADVGIVATQSALAQERAAIAAEISSAIKDTAAARTELTARLAALGGKIDALEQSGAKGEALAGLGRKIDDMERSGAKSDALAAARAESTGELSKKLAEIEGRLSDLRARADAPRARLASAISGVAIFFDRDKPLEQNGLNERLDLIAKLLGEPGPALRIVGYSDDTGSSAANMTISRRRAEVLADMLMSRGASKDKIKPIGRGNADPIADSTPGNRERNRRAVFEIFYDGEDSQ